MNFRLPGFLLLPLLTVPANAVPCSMDTVPAATLLLPYFEVELEAPGGFDTRLVHVVLHNASPAAILTSVVLWTDLAVPVFQFNLYLEGFGLQRIDLWDILHGILPVTGPGVSSPGPFSPPNPNLDLGSCSGILPPSSPIPSTLVAAVQNALQGRPSLLFGGKCGGLNFEDGMARGYMTVDVVKSCALLFPGDPGYFVADELEGIASDDNVLWGSYYYADLLNFLEQGDALIHLEAQPGLFGPDAYTFYGRYVEWTGADHREPLPTRFHVGHQARPLHVETTDLVVWRDTKVAQEAFTCGDPPSWFPLAANELVAFDEEQRPVPLDRWGASPPPPSVASLFPAAAQRVNIGPQLPQLFNSGGLYLDLNTTVPTAPGVPPALLPVAQAWVTSLETRGGLYGVGFPAVQLDSACSPPVPAASLLGSRTAGTGAAATNGRPLPSFLVVPPILPLAFCGPQASMRYLESKWRVPLLLDVYDCTPPVQNQSEVIACSDGGLYPTADCQALGVPLP